MEAMLGTVDMAILSMVVGRVAPADQVEMKATRKTVANLEARTMLALTSREGAKGRGDG